MAIATIDLTQDTVQTDRGAVKITITATGNNITGAVFAIEVLPRSSDSLDPIYRFSHVCSPSELLLDGVVDAFGEAALFSAVLAERI